jgi:hypothetical protein
VQTSVAPTRIGQHTETVDVLRRRRRPASADGLRRCQVLTALGRREDLGHRPRRRRQHLVGVQHGRPRGQARSYRLQTSIQCLQVCPLLQCF